MNSTSLQTELSNLFEQRKFQSILERAQSDEISPANNPHASNIVAAALFQIGRFSDCLLWCEALSPSLSGNASFISMYGAVLRRLGRLEEAEQVFRAALETNSDNPFLRNNFANLLIDRQEFKEAELILKNLLKKSLIMRMKKNLIIKFQQNLTESAPRSDKSAAPEQFLNDDLLIDPLAAPLATKLQSQVELPLDKPPKNKKVKQGLIQRLYRGNGIRAPETILLHVKPLRLIQQAIQDCILLHNKLGVQAPIYEVAAEAYIRMKLFGDAETCLLVAHSLGSNDASISLNLANLAAMRGDQRLALQWLEQLSQRQPDHPQLDAVRKTLFPNGAPKNSSTPFQINLDQKSPGSFT